MVPMAVAGLLLVLMGALMLASASMSGPTADEPVYVGSSVVQARWHDATYNGEHPPLAKLISGVPLRFVHVSVPRSLRAPGYSSRIGDKHRAQYSLARYILFRKPNSVRHLIWLARVPMIILTLLFAVAVLGFATDLFGLWAGVLALAAIVGSPVLLGYGRLAGNDVPVSGFMLITLWMLYRARARHPAWLAAAGLAYGCALASKFTALLLGPFVVALTVAAVVRHREDFRRWRRVVGSVAAVLTLSIVVVWATYAVVDPSFRSDSPPQAHTVHGLMRTLIGLLPLPRQYREGMLVQASFEHVNWTNFFFGDVAQSRHLAYLPAALLLKTPVGLLVLTALGYLALRRHRSHRATLCYVIAPALFLFMLSFVEKREFGVRYVLWMPLAMAIVCAGWLTVRTRRRLVVAAALAGSALFSTTLAFPWFISYANVAAGGSAHEYRLFSDADEGQELPALASWLHAHDDGRPRWLAYNGTTPPLSYGVDAASLSNAAATSVHGFVALGVNQLDYDGQRYRWITNGRSPVADIGHAFLVYDIP